MLRPALRAARDVVYRIIYRGTGRFCPVCTNTVRRFAPFGMAWRTEAMCPHCGALARHRLVWLFFERHTDLFDGRRKQVLHIAPERGFTARLRSRLDGGYVTADLSAPDVDVQMDITDIRYPGESFDVIYCSHVLEHVPNDRGALAQFHRVLRRTGWAVILVPITAEQTFEDPSVTDPKQRERLFGQNDHVRRYGPDFVTRLSEAGFAVQVLRCTDVADGAEISRMGLARGGEIFFCTRPSSA